MLLLNACLTVRAHNANSHAGKGWEKLTDSVISWLNKYGDGIVFMLWGAYAQKKGACIDKVRPTKEGIFFNIAGFNFEQKGQTHSQVTNYPIAV